MRPVSLRALLLATLLGAAAVATPGAQLAPEVPLGLPDSVAEALVAPPAQVDLGRRLFFDPILSSDRSVSCASCHEPERAFADPRPKSVGVGGETARHAPSLVNRALGRSFHWDGEVATLEEQALLPIASPVEMNLSIEEAVARLAADASYVTAFEEAWGGEPTAERLAGSLATFVRTLISGGSRVDRFRAGEIDALNEAERAGFWLYESRGGCWKCHSGANFSDEKLHNTGVATGGDDLGRMAVTGDEADRGRFKTPTLREVGRTAPYMHDGSLETLYDVVEFYKYGGKANPNLDSRMAPLDLSERDMLNLVAFLEALGGE